MKKFLFQFLAFLFLFILLNVIYLGLVRNFDWNFAKHLEAQKLNPKDYDCLVLGNSLAMDGIDTKYLSEQGLKSYNLSLGGASLQSSKIQLERYLDSASKSPKYVILGLGSCIGQNLEKSTVHPLLRIRSKKLSIYQIPFIKYKWMAKEIAKKIVSKDHRNAELENGQLRIQKTVVDTSSYSGERTSNLDSNHYDSIVPLNEIAEICKSKGIVFFVMEMPGIRNTHNDIPIGPHLLNEDKNYLFHNFNNKDFCKLFNADEDWLGGSHLNAKGARKFTEAISSYIGL